MEYNILIREKNYCKLDIIIQIWCKLTINMQNRKFKQWLNGDQYYKVEDKNCNDK